MDGLLYLCLLCVRHCPGTSLSTNGPYFVLRRRFFFHVLAMKLCFLCQWTGLIEHLLITQEVNLALDTVCSQAAPALELPCWQLVSPISKRKPEV